MSVLKVGDKVRAVGNCGGYWRTRGKLGTIKSPMFSGFSVAFDDWPEGLYFTGLEVKTDLIKVEGEDKMTEFKVGDKVTLNPLSRWVGAGSRNPLGVEGKILEIQDFGSLPIRVEWPVGGNNYSAEDLIKKEVLVGKKFTKSNRNYFRTVLVEFEDGGEQYVVTKDSDDNTKQVNRKSYLADDGWLLEEDTKETELTLTQIAEKFGIDVSKVRIKE